VPSPTSCDRTTPVVPRGPEVGKAYVMRTAPQVKWVCKITGPGLPATGALYVEGAPIGLLAMPRFDTSIWMPWS
jgi:hypothetical protein